MISLDRLGIFIAIVDAGSLTAAAAVLGQSKAVVSFNLKQLEAELGVSLLTRSTRSLALTDVGRRFYEDCQRVLSEAQGAIETARQGHQGLRGTLRLTTTVEYGSRTVIPALIAFAAAHPQLQIQHSSSSSHEDLISGGYDLAIRMGSLNDSSYRAAQDDAAIHSDSASALLGFALGGCGVALLPQWQVEAEVRAGRLRHLLPDVVFPGQGVYAVYAHTQHIPEKVRAFIDFLRAFVGTTD